MILESSWPYENEKCILVPYDKTWKVFPDGILGHLYLRTKQDGMLDTVFDSGLDFNGFVTYFSKRSVQAQIYSLKIAGAIVPAGVCWVDDVAGSDGARRAMFGFLFFKEYRRRPEIADLGWFGLMYWYRELKIDMLFGATMRENIPARRFARRFGFAEIAELPLFLNRRGTLCDATVVSMSRVDFEPRYQRWLETKLEAVSG